MRCTVSLVAVLTGLFLAPGLAQAQNLEKSPGRVNRLKILSDKVDDVTTVENILASALQPGMSDEERARALWEFVVKYRHQTLPPNEYLAGDWEAHDPVKIFNVYGYCMCCCTSALIAALNRADGREARGRILNGHSVPEVRYGDAWHMFDASLIANFPKPDGGGIASVDEIADAVGAWLKDHPAYRKDGDKLFALMKSDQWMGWKEKGPALLANCPFYKMGYLPARTHGWDATMVEYDRKSEVYEYGYQVGHQALFSLRPGESIVREAGNRGLHVNRESMPDWPMLKARAPENDLVYVKDFLPGYRGGVVGNGVQRYAPDLASGELAQGAEVFENLAVGGLPALHPKDGDRPGVVVIGMSSPYVYLGGRVRLKFTGHTKRDHVAVSLSTNNGRTFTTLLSTKTNGSTAAVIDLDDKILKRYAYLLKIQITSTLPGSAGIDSLVIENDFQHAPRSLPRLGKGSNTITVAADGDPAIATRSIAPRITDDPTVSKNETLDSMGVRLNNLKIEYDACWWQGDKGVLTVPIDVPGDLVALRFSAQVRARGEKDLVKMLVSADDGKTWREAGKIAGPTPGRTAAFRVADWPEGTRKALLRFELTGNNTIGVLNFRADADFRDPIAAPPGKLHPIKVVHRWTEDGRERSHEESITALPARYTIETKADPELISVAAEMGPARP